MTNEKELKTLNEIIEPCDICKKYPQNNCHHPCCRNNKKIKAEAVKILKEIRKARELAREGDYSLMKKFWEEKRILIEDMDGELCDGEALLKWWINLTEEDLE